MELKSLQDIFNNKIFRIPDYQRGYAWGKKQLDDIWRDLNTLEDEKIHYTGLLSVVPAGHGRDFIYVVDGQQRLTTLIILIHCICQCEQLTDKDWVNGHEKEDYRKKYLHYKTGKQGEIEKMVFGYEQDNPSHIHFKTKILGLDNLENEPGTLYTNNLDKAKLFFEEKIQPLNFKEIETVLKKVTNQLHFLYYLLDSRINQFVTFETLNYRGKPLTTLELLKNRLMYLSSELHGHGEDERTHLRQYINDAWKTIYEYLGKNPDSELSDDDFLMAHWIMYFDEYDRSGSKVFASFLLDSHFTLDNLRSGTIKYESIKDYIFDIEKVVKAWYLLHNPNESKYSKSVKIWLGKLNRLNFRSFRPLIASILANNIEDKKIVQTLEIVERFNFILFGLRINKRQTNYKTVPIYNKTYAAHKSPEEFDPNVFSLEKLDVNRLDFSFSKEKFLTTVDENNDHKFYDWAGLKYFLFEYEVDLQKQAKNDEFKLQWTDIYKTTEHIYPQNPKRGCWPKFSSKKAKEQLHELGNLLLISRSSNARLGNRSFREKKKIYQKDSYSAIDVSQVPDWTPKTIQDRQKRMLDFLWNRWEIEES